MHRFMRTAAVATPLLIALALLPTLQAQTAAPQAQTAQPAATEASKPDPRDPDGDKRISWDEYRGTMTANFARLDANKNGILETTEIPGQPTGQQLARAEFEGRMRDAFDRQDIDKDGYLAGAEVPSKKVASPQK